MVSFVKAITLPFQDLKKLLIGAALYMLPIVNIITGLFAYGYALEVAKRSMNQDFSLPEWTDGRSLLTNGILATVIGLLWMIPALIIIMIAFVGAGIGAASTGGGITGLIVAITIAVIVFLATWYVLPSALLNYAQHTTFGAGFDFHTITSRALTKKYLVGWLLAFLVAVAVTLVGVGIIILLGALASNAPVGGVVIGILAYIINGFVAFVELIIMFALYGEAWAKA
jgi:hypothetical protein